MNEVYKPSIGELKVQHSHNNLSLELNRVKKNAAEQGVRAAHLNIVK